VTDEECKRRTLEIATQLAAAYVQGLAGHGGHCCTRDTMDRLAPMFVDWAIKLTNEVSSRYP
jgi:hypothetical protein